MKHAHHNQRRNLTVVLTFALVIASLAGVAGQPVARANTGYDLWISINANRTNAALLEGRTVAGTIFVFTAPDTANITRVTFWLDDPDRTGAPWRVENSAPYDFNGGTVAVASPWDTRTIADGEHVVTAEVQRNDGPAVVVSSTFTVQNESTGTGAELVFNPDPLHLVADLNGQPVVEAVTLVAADGTPATFTVTDNVSWLTVSPNFGVTPAMVNVTANPAGLLAGSYNATVTASANGYTTGEMEVVLFVSDTRVDQIHLSWVGDPSTTMTVIWRTQDPAVPSEAQYRPAGSPTWSTATGGPRPSGTAGTLHEVTFTGLSPDTSYEYRVRESASTWSEIHTTRTAPPPGPADFDFIYVADTGLVGRLDGLATGTQQVIDEIAALNPLLILGGGDYSYFNTDKRFGTLDNTTDVWFNQMQPVLTSSPIMPTYGNHEDSLHENFYTWSARFATPPGFDERRNYSFDIGDVHFVSIYVVFNGFPIPDATVNWIRQDVLDAKARGQRWIVPYFHVSPFSDGTNHPSNMAFRRQIGPLFEELGVKVAIASHDQSYERTYPLIDVPRTNTPTSTALDCYTMADGVTWVKVSPGGKLSNINAGFAEWATDPPPPWTAFRDNTMHHFLRGTVTASGVLEIEVYGLAGDGSPPVIIDSFHYSMAGCGGDPPPTAPDTPAGLTATASASGISLDWDDNTEPDLTGYNVYRSTSPAGPFSKLNGSPLTASDYADTGAPSGVESFYRVTAVNPAGESGPATISATRPGDSPYSLVYSTSSNRANPLPLAGATISGTIYPFTTPDTQGIMRVRFFLDDPAMLNPPWLIENNPPYDFNGGTVIHGKPFNTNTISNGEHTITAVFQMADGTTIAISATFTVAN